MSSVRWQPRDEGSGPGHLQAVVPDGVYARYHAFISHYYDCDDCEYGEIRCPTAKGLWAAYIGARDGPP